MTNRVAILLAFAMAVPSAGTSAPLHGLARGDAVRYTVTIPGDTVEVAIEVGGVENCRDGLERIKKCTRVRIDHSAASWGQGAQRMYFAGMSRAHAEVISLDLGGPTPVFEYARPSRLWVGYPGLSAIDPGEGDPVLEGVRAVVVGALTIPLRRHLGDLTASTIGGTAMSFEQDGDTVVARQLVRERVSYHLTSDGGFYPASIDVRAPDGSVLATAHRTALTRGTQAISFPSWAPLDFPRAPGARFETWDRLPPGGDGLPVFYPHDQASKLAALWPETAVKNAANPDWYQLGAIMLESGGTPLVAGIEAPLHTGVWALWNASASAGETWDTTPRRDGASGTPVYADTVSSMSPFPFGLGSGDLVRRIPARESLPDEVWALDDAFAFAEQRVAIGSDGFIFGWLVFPLTGLAGTPDEIVIALQCGTGASWLWPESWIIASAVTGQILTHTGGDVAECERSDDGLFAGTSLPAVLSRRA